MKTEHEVIKNVLTDFLGTETIDETFDGGFVGLVADEDDIEILTLALTEALEKNRNEN